MGFDIAFGLAFAAVGAAILICTLAHPSPRSLAFVRFFAWPRTDMDRTDLVLSGWFYIGIGAFWAVLAADVSRALALVPVAVMLCTGIALGVRRRDV